MNQEQIEKSTKLAKKYKRLKKGSKESIECRNELFILLKPWMDKWVGSILIKLGIYEEKESITSLGWSCFIFSLEKYKKGKEIRLPSHFHKYSEYYIKKWLKDSSKHQKNQLYISDLNQEIGNNIFAENVVDSIRFLDALKAFRESLPDNYKIVFEDAIASMSPGTKQKVRRIKKSGMSYYNYSEAKRIFSYTIWFLKRYMYNA